MNFQGNNTFDRAPRNYERNFSTKYKPMRYNQCIVNEGTEEELLCTAYRETKTRKFVYYGLTILTLGLLHLICYWKPPWKLKIRAAFSDLSVATHVILKDKFKQEHVRRIKWLNFQSSLQNVSPTDGLELQDMEKDVTKRKRTATGKQALTLHELEENPTKPRRYFEHKFQKYVWSMDTFFPLRGLDHGSTVEELKGMNGGLPEERAHHRKLLFGINSITVEITPYLVILFREIINPFYAFQLFSIVVWCVEQYFLLAGIIALLSIVSISLSLYMTRKENVLIHRMSSGSGPAQVLTKSGFVSRDSTELLPGDVIEIQDRVETMWCDCVLLSGTCVVNESMLTGESVPLTKTPLVSSKSDMGENVYDASKHKQHTIYGGTKVLDAHPAQSKQLPRALVIRTGFYTEKGKMIETILSPDPVNYRFYHDSLRFILFMAVLGVIGGIIAITVLAMQGAPAIHIVKRILDLITIVVPPGLPAAITIATLYAQRRLKNYKIFCISPPRISISGKINCMCFDKTGTLTEDGLKLWGVVPLKDKDLTEEEKLEFFDTVHAFPEMGELGSVGRECMHAMASCHSLIKLNNEILGDPLDLELFNAVGWMMTDPCEEWSKECSKVLSPTSPTGHIEVESLGILRIFQFNSVLQRMSVVVQRKKSQEKSVYVKGAPETVASLCQKNTVPEDFTGKLQHFTKKGYRVLALARRELKEENINVETLSRDVVESELSFLAFVVLTNPLKPRTKDTMTALKNADIRTVMSTGDNLETAMFVARKCDMISQGDKLVIVEATRLGDTDGIKVSWKPDSTEVEIVKTCQTSSDGDIYFSMENGIKSGYHLALTGTTFSLLRQHAPKLFARVLASATVFARMKPDHKNKLVEGLQSIDYTVGMCGDGANDCGALKSAHAGVALAEAESSIIAHFTSMEKNISCCYKLIREGRAALVTSFGMIKYLCLYSFVQYLTLIVLYTINSYMSNGQFLFADIGVTGVAVLFFAIGGASLTLTKKPPHKSLVSPVMITCLSLQIFLLIFFQAISYVTLKSQTWHTPLVPNMTHPTENVKCEENTVMFYTACCQYLTLAYITYKGRPHRKPIYRNVVYLVLLILLTCWAFVMLFAAVPPIDSWFGLTPLNYQVGFKFVLLALFLLYVLCAVFVEYFLLESKWFALKLNALCWKCRPRRSTVSQDGGEPEDAFRNYRILRKEIAVDSNWPPVNSTVIIKT